MYIMTFIRAGDFKRFRKKFQTISHAVNYLVNNYRDLAIDLDSLNSKEKEIFCKKFFSLMRSRRT